MSFPVPGAGGADDWVYAEAGVDLSYTLELPPCHNKSEKGFIPGKNEIIPVGRETFEALKVIIQQTEGKHCHNDANNYFVNNFCIFFYIYFFQMLLSFVY